jgi:hypothetical protein
MSVNGMDGFKRVKGKILVVIGKAGVRKVIGYKSETDELLLRDDRRPEAKAFSMPAKDVLKVDMQEVLRAVAH